MPSTLTKKQRALVAELREMRSLMQLGFEEILIGSQFGAIEEIERVRDFLKS